MKSKTLQGVHKTIDGGGGAIGRHEYVHTLCTHITKKNVNDQANVHS